MTKRFWSWLLCKAVIDRLQPCSRRLHRTSVVRSEELEQRLLLSGDAPVATPANVVTLEDKPLIAQLAATDKEFDPLSFKPGPLVPLHGEVTIDGNGTFTYIPAINFNGTDSFSFIAFDGTSNSKEAVVSINVTAVNDIPTVNGGFASANEDLAYPGTLVPLVEDADGDSLDFSVVSTTTHGTLALNASGTFTYTPAANYNGPDSFTYRVNDGQANSATATFQLDVSPVDDALKVTFPSPAAQVPRTSSPVRIDPAATVADIDTVINYANTQIRTTIISGNSNGDNTFGRVTLKLLGQGPGPGLVEVKGSKVYFNDSEGQIASVSGGTLGRALVIKFSKGATEQAVNAVLKQISLQASKKATVGSRNVFVVVSTSKGTASATRAVSVV